MRSTTAWMVSLSVIAALSPARGQGPVGSAGSPVVAVTGAPVSPAQETARLADEITVLRSINPVNLSAEQIQALIEVLEPGMQRLDRQDQERAKQWAPIATQLREAAAQLTSAPAQRSPAEIEYARLEQLSRQAHDTARAQLRDQVRAVLEKTLTPEQRETVVTEGQAAFVRLRLAQLLAGNRGAIDPMASTLDQLRQADARAYPAQRQLFALRTAEVNNWQALLRGGSGGAPAGVAGRVGRRGAGMNAGGASPGAQQLQQELNDPATQARIRDYLALADTVRGMPEARYRQQRSQIALQLWEAREARRTQPNPQQSMDAFIERTLLTPVTVGVLEEKRKRASNG